MHREKEVEIGDLCLKERGRKERHELGESHAQHNAGDKGHHRDNHRLERHDRGDAPAPHAEHLVQAKLLLAAFHDEVIGIHHQKGHDTGQKVRQVAEHAAHNLRQALFIDAGDIDLHRDGVKGIEDRDAQGERQKVDEVVAAGAADVAPSEFTEHRSPHRPSWQRPP